MQALFWARYQSGLRAEGNKQNGPLLLIRVSDLISEKYLVEEIYGELLQTSPLCTASSFPPAVIAFKFSFQCATAESSWEQTSVLFTGQESVISILLCFGKNLLCIVHVCWVSICLTHFLFLLCLSWDHCHFSPCTQVNIQYVHTQTQVVYRLNQQRSIIRKQKTTPVKSDCFSSNTFRGLQCFFKKKKKRVFICGDSYLE